MCFFPTLRAAACSQRLAVSVWMMQLRFSSGAERATAASIRAITYKTKPASVGAGAGSGNANYYARRNGSRLSSFSGIHPKRNICVI